ncbi:MAG: FRG domain-containing protein [Planctomycetota bacterium]
MTERLRRLPAKVRKEYEKWGPECPLYDYYVRDLSDYFAVFSTMLTERGIFWFRGHSHLRYRFTPSALRYSTESERNKALGLLAEFRRLGEIKLDKPPSPEDDLKWLQLAQHYGLPTRLLDWTENAAAALYFACRRLDCHGLIGILNPIDLNRSVDSKRPRIFDAHLDAKVIAPYLKLTGRINRRGSRTIAIFPILNSERILLQKGVFTLHGSRAFALERTQVPSLVYVPVLQEVKRRLVEELDRVGINEMSLFPELEHVCTHLKKRARLE